MDEIGQQMRLRGIGRRGKALGKIRSSLLGTASTAGARYTAEDSFAAVLPRFNALYRVTDGLNLYATISKGRRSPVVQLAAAAAGTAVRPNLQSVPEETVWNYEAGVKAALGGFTGTASVFYQDYQGFQVSVTQPNGTALTQSAGSAKNPGVEFEGTYHLSPILSAFGSFAYIDGKIDRGNNVTPAYAGARFRLQPKTTASGGTSLEASRPTARSGAVESGRAGRPMPAPTASPMR